MGNGGKYPGHAGGRLIEWLARCLKAGKAQRLRAETRAEALTIAYCRRLVAELHNLEILDISYGSASGDPSYGLARFGLETFYIPLQVREYNGQGEFTGHFRESRAVFHSRRHGDLCLFRVMSPEEALLRFHHLAVLGDPGAGKTTMLKYLTLLAASSPRVRGKSASEDPSYGSVSGDLSYGLPDFPILVSLGHFAAVPQVNLLDFVISEIEAHAVERASPDAHGFPVSRLVGGLSEAELRSYLEERLEKGSVLFLLDGLDEVNVGLPYSSSSILHPSSATYRHVVGQINVLAARYPNCPMVVTARRGSWKGLLAASFHAVEVLGFNRDDIQRFIVNWFSTTDRARDLQDALSQNPRLWALAANPLLLSLMAFIFEQDGELPEGRVGLYKRGVELLLSATDGKSLMDTEHKRSLLEEVALHFHLRRALLFLEDELRGVISNYLTTVERASPDVGGLSRGRSLHHSKPVQESRHPQVQAVDIPTDRVSTVLKGISSRHSLLRQPVGGWYSFPHSTWQEYFAAAALSKRGWVENGEWRVENRDYKSLLSSGEWGVENRDYKSLLSSGEWRMEERLHDPWWEGTALFLAGILGDATPFLKSILAQEEDIFHSNLLLAGRCLAACRPEPALRVEGVGLRIIEGLKGMVEGGHHRLLQWRAISVLAELGSEVVASFFVALLRREDIDLDVRVKIAEILGSLHDRSVIPDLLAFLTDEKLDFSVRGNIAEALGALGDESVIPPFLALLPDETVDSSVRGRIVEALSVLGGESVVSPLLAFLPDERVNPYVREKIAEVLAFLGDGGTSCQLVLLLSDEKMRPSVRRRVAEAVGSLGDESVVPDLLALLFDEEIDSSVRGKAAEALGVLGAESAVPPLLALLGDEKVDYNVRMAVAEALGVLGENSASRLLALLSDGKIDPDVRASIAGALGALGDQTMVPPLLSLLPDESIDPSVRWRIVDALSALGDKTIIPHLRALLPNEEIDSSVRWMVAEALKALFEERGERREVAENGEWREETLGSLDDRSRVPQLLALLKDERMELSVSKRIIEALGSLGDDRATVEGLAALLDREDIGSRVYEALFSVSQRAGMRVFARKGRGYEVRPFEYVQEG
jgi:HEAT repeat protein